MVNALLALASLVSVAQAGISAGGVTFVATATDATTTTVCITAKVAQGQWVGFGIGSQMSGANLLIVYPDSTGAPALLEGNGNGHDFSALAAPVSKINTAKSSYTGGTLVACVDRPATISGLSNGNNNYLYATGGSISNGNPSEHRTASSVSGNLFGAVPTGGALGVANQVLFGVITAAIALFV